MLKVSVIMTVYNGEKYLREAMDSILNQTFKDFEFVIINDASTDKSQEILDVCKDNRIKLIINQQNIGMVNSRNKGLALAQSEYITVVDHDDIALPERLEKQIRFLDEHPEIGLVGGYYYEIDEQGKEFNLYQSPTTNEEIQRKLLTEDCFGHGTIMFRRECLGKAGYYRPEFEYMDDYDFVLRISEKYQVASIPEPVYKWRRGPRSATVSRSLLMVKLYQLCRDLARERRLYGKDRLQIPEKRQDVIDYINSCKKENASRRGKGENYLHWSKFFRMMEDRKNTFKFLWKSLSTDPFNYRAWVFLGSFFTALSRKLWLKINL